ncbi:hypothetical protein ES708_31566 [subsurface metagenome]
MPTFGVDNQNSNLRINRADIDIAINRNQGGYTFLGKLDPRIICTREVIGEN